jgi:hypothetical protein
VNDAQPDSFLKRLWTISLDYFMEPKIKEPTSGHPREKSNQELDPNHETVNGAEVEGMEEDEGISEDEGMVEFEGISEDEGMEEIKEKAEVEGIAEVEGTSEDERIAEVEDKSPNVPFSQNFPRL